MPSAYRCEACGNPFQIPDEYLGAKVACPWCSTEVSGKSVSAIGFWEKPAAQPEKPPANDPLVLLDRLATTGLVLGCLALLYALNMSVTVNSSIGPVYNLHAAESRRIVLIASIVVCAVAFLGKVLIAGFRMRK